MTYKGKHLNNFNLLNVLNAVMMAIAFYCSFDGLVILQGLRIKILQF
jgi:hypothetical protein